MVKSIFEYIYKLYVVYKPKIHTLQIKPIDW